MLPPLAPHPPPTQSTRKVLYAPHLLSLSAMCVSECEWVRASGLSGRGGTRTCARGQVGPLDGEFQSDSAADGDTGDRRRRAVKDTCHSVFQSHLGSEGGEGGNVHARLFPQLSYQHLQRYLVPARPSYYGALSRLPTNASHIPAFSRPKEINNYFLKDSGN